MCPRPRSREGRVRTQGVHGQSCRGRSVSTRLAECPGEGRARARARARASRIRMLTGGVRLVGGESGPPRRLAGAAKDLGQLEQIIAFHSVCR